MYLHVIILAQPCAPEKETGRRNSGQDQCRLMDKDAGIEPIEHMNVCT